MSEFRVNSITNLDGLKGPKIAGVTTFSGVSGMKIPTGSTNKRKLPEGYVSKGIKFYIDVSHPDSYTPGETSITDIILGTQDTVFHGDPAFAVKDGVQSLYFDGSDDGIRMDRVDSVAYIPDGGPLSFSTWVYVASDFTDGGTIMSNQRCNSPSFQLWINGGGGYNPTDAPGALHWRVCGGNTYVADTQNEQIGKGVPLTPNDVAVYLDRRGAWMNVVGTFSGTTAKIYVNGELTGVNRSAHEAFSQQSPTDTGLTFMNRHPCGSMSWVKGWFSQAAVYRHELSAAEVLQNFNALKERHNK